MENRIITPLESNEVESGGIQKTFRQTYMTFLGWILAFSIMWGWWTFALLSLACLGDSDPSCDGSAILLRALGSMGLFIVFFLAVPTYIARASTDQTKQLALFDKYKQFVPLFVVGVFSLPLLLL